MLLSLILLSTCFVATYAEGRLTSSVIEGFLLPVGPPVRQYEQPNVINRFSPFFPTTPFQQTKSQYLIIPNRFPSSGIRVNPFPFQSQYPLAPNLPIRMPSAVQVPLSPVFPLFVGPMTSAAAPSLSQGSFGSQAHLNELLRRYIEQVRRSNKVGLCSYFSSTGVCQSHSQCTSEGGRATTYCRDVTKFCCIYRWSCDQLTSQKVGYFRNPDYPLSSSVSSSCGITVKKISPDICIIRVQPTKLTLPANIGYCDDLAFNADGVPGIAYEPLCGDLSEKTYDIDVSLTDSVTLRINTLRTTRLHWNVKVSQISCSEQSLYKWPILGTGAVPPPPPQPPLPLPPLSQPQPPQKSPPQPTIVQGVAPGFSVQNVSPPGSSNLHCGIARRRSSLNVRGNGQFDPAFGGLGGFLQLQQIIEGEQLGVPFNEALDYEYQEDCDEKFDGECVLKLKKPNPLLQSLEWDVPSVNDSLLYKYAGTPLTVAQRITFGKKTRPHAHPWNIAMYNNGRFHCGGTLISSRHILTAAHCVIKSQRRPERLRLSIGDWDINSNLDGPSIQSEISKIVTHPGYSTHTLKYDVAVLTLKENVQYTDTIVPICLPDADFNLEGEIITVSGWGRDEKNRLQSQLMEHSAAVVSNQVCNERWQQKGAPTGIIANTMLCMDPQDGDSCKGDSGGPAIMEYPPNSNRFIQVGIVSFGSSSCTDKLLPGVYTKVSKVTDWIRKQMSS